MAPNHFFVVEQVYAAGTYDLRTRDGCGTFVEAAVAALHAVDPRWGHLRKTGGTQYNGHAHDGGLYYSDTPGQSQFVDFIAGAEGPSPSLYWNPDTPRYSVGDWYAPASTPGPVPQPSPQPSPTCRFQPTNLAALEQRLDDLNAGIVILSERLDRIDRLHAPDYSDALAGLSAQVADVRKALQNGLAIKGTTRVSGRIGALAGEFAGEARG